MSAAIPGLLLAGTMPNASWWEPERVTTVELHNTIDDVPANGMRALGFKVPGDGLLEIDLLVHQGPGVASYVIRRTDSSAVLKATDFRLFPEFSTEPASAARKSAAVMRGRYFLTLINAHPSEATRLRVLLRFTPKGRPARHLHRSKRWPCFGTCPPPAVCVVSTSPP